MLKLIGADAVGMSTVLEALAGSRLGMRVAGISVITNLATGISTGRLSHDDVTAGAARAGEHLRAILTKALAQIASEDVPPTNFRR
jgi:purine-nucleoside phosphorylase